jgi:hypothetical protein
MYKSLGKCCPLSFLIFAHPSALNFYEKALIIAAFRSQFLSISAARRSGGPLFYNLQDFFFARAFHFIGEKFSPTIAKFHVRSFMLLCVASLATTRFPYTFGDLTLLKRNPL